MSLLEWMLLGAAWLGVGYLGVKLSATIIERHMPGFVMLFGPVALFMSGLAFLMRLVEDWEIGPWGQ